MAIGRARFVRSENVKHYTWMLERITNPQKREQIEKLLAEEKQKQADAGDFDPQRVEC